VVRPDPYFLALGSTPGHRQQRYKEFVEQGIRERELKFIGGGVRRNQLTGSEHSSSNLSSGSASASSIEAAADRDRQNQKNPANKSVPFFRPSLHRAYFCLNPTHANSP